MNEAQIKQVREIVREIAKERSTSFGAALKVAIGVLRLHTLNTPKGEGQAGSPIKPCTKRPPTAHLE
jgi:hypothetical protein